MNMPTYEVFIDGRPRRIELSKSVGSSFMVNVDGKPVNVELQSDRLVLAEPFRIKIDGKTYQICIEKIERDSPFGMKVEEASFKTEVKLPAIKASATTSASTSTVTTARKGVIQKEVAEGAVTAPMTGKIVLVKVKEGEQVKQNQVLCVIEAMKMENEITAPKAGVVREVKVSEGASVSEGEALFLIS